MALHYINKYNMMAVRLTSKWDIRRLAKTTGATALPRVTAPTAEEFGLADQELNFIEICPRRVTGSVVDPDPYDPYIFGPLGSASGSVSHNHKYGSGSGSGPRRSGIEFLLEPLIRTAVLLPAVLWIGSGLLKPIRKFVLRYQQCCGFRFNGVPGSGSGFRRAKMTHKRRKS
jgi:hypothetical protein